MFAAVYPVFYAHFSETQKGIKWLDVLAAAYDAVFHAQVGYPCAVHIIPLTVQSNSVPCVICGSFRQLRSAVALAGGAAFNVKAIYPLAVAQRRIKIGKAAAGGFHSVVQYGLKRYYAQICGIMRRIMIICDILPRPHRKGICLAVIIGAAVAYGIGYGFYLHHYLSRSFIIAAFGDIEPAKLGVGDCGVKGKVLVYVDNTLDRLKGAVGSGIFAFVRL